jgi:hypothetical protein
MAAWKMNRKEKKEAPTEEEAKQEMLEARRKSRRRRTLGGEATQRKPLSSCNGSCPYCDKDIEDLLRRAVDGATLNRTPPRVLRASSKLKYPSPEGMKKVRLPPIVKLDCSMGIAPLNVVCPHCDSMLRVQTEIQFTLTEIPMGNPPPEHLKWCAGQYLDVPPDQRPSNKKRKKGKRK